MLTVAWNDFLYVPQCLCLAENPPGLVEPNAWLELDDWEMPRQDVVMNRKLGSGTFGTGKQASKHLKLVSVSLRELVGRIF